MISWVFDDPSRYRTMSQCPDTVIAPDLSFVSGRFPTPNLFWYWVINGQLDCYGLDNRPARYCYNIGTWIQSEYWAGFDGNEWGFKNLFELVPDVVLEDARNLRALLVIDNLVEGFQNDDLFRFWHQSCDRYRLPPRSIVYMTSNFLEKEAYLKWVAENNITDTINVISFCHLEFSQQKCMLTSYPMIEWDEHLDRKSKPFRIKDFNCLNRMPRWHREYLTLKMIEADLHRNALISHNTMNLDNWSDVGIDPVAIDKATELLPLVVDDPDFENNKAMHINQEIYLNSWISVVTETHAHDESKCLFISEKIWKPIYALHPFMVLGHQGTLAALHGMGYKTFDGMIDESYDSAPFESRVNIILNNLRRIRVIRDKLGWFEECRDICLHNRRNFVMKEFFDSQACKDLVKLYDGLSR